MLTAKLRSFPEGTCASRGPQSNRELHHPGTVIRRRITLNRNDLGGGFTVARTSRLRDPIALASFRLGFCLRVSYLLSRSVRIPANRDVRLRYLESNGSPEICQDFFQEIAILAHFSRNRLILKYLPEIAPDGKPTRARRRSGAHRGVAPASLRLEVWWHETIPSSGCVGNLRRVGASDGGAKSSAIHFRLCPRPFRFRQSSGS